MPGRHRQRVAIKMGGLFVAFTAVLSCGGHDTSNLCDCHPKEPDSADFRHAEKHIPIPGKLGAPTAPLTVQTILSWPQHESVPDRPRIGRETLVFQVNHAFLQWASVQDGDCDLHLEISATLDKQAPRVMVETPKDPEYCTARQSLQSQLKQHGFDLSQSDGGEIQHPLPVSVRGMPFEDFEHNRGTALIATTWELHPATVSLE